MRENRRHFRENFSAVGFYFSRCYIECGEGIVDMPISPIIGEEEGGSGKGGRGFPHLVSNTTCRRWSIGGGYVAGERGG